MFDEQLAQTAAGMLRSVRENKPLVHSITNYVTMNYTANALLACGASAVMAHAEEEVEEMARIADALVLNVGTLEPARLESMLKAGRTANRCTIPIILDPVGAGATTLRTRACKRLLSELSIQVVRGNPSEILSLLQEASGTKGVESVHLVEESVEVALHLAKTYALTVAITGKVDFVTDGGRTLRVHNGHAMMGLLTGAGCAATAVIGAFASVGLDRLEATAAALSYFGLAGEKAAEKAAGPGTFQVRFLDALYRLGEEDLRQGAKIEKRLP